MAARLRRALPALQAVTGACNANGEPMCGLAGCQSAVDRLHDMKPLIHERRRDC